MSNEPPFRKTLEIDSLAMEIAEMLGSLVPIGGLAASPTMHRELRIKAIHSSLAIEGNSLSEEVVSAILDGKRVLGAASDIRDARNADRAYAMLTELDPTSIADLLRVHGVMMDGLIPEAGHLPWGLFQGGLFWHA